MNIRIIGTATNLVISMVILLTQAGGQVLANVGLVLCRTFSRSCLELGMLDFEVGKKIVPSPAYAKITPSHNLHIAFLLSFPAFSVSSKNSQVALVCLFIDWLHSYVSTSTWTSLTREVNLDVLRMHNTRDTLPKHSDASLDSR